MHYFSILGHFVSCGSPKIRSHFSAFSDFQWNSHNLYQIWVSVIIQIFNILICWIIFKLKFRGVLVAQFYNNNMYFLNIYTWIYPWALPQATVLKTFDVWFLWKLEIHKKSWWWWVKKNTTLCRIFVSIMQQKAFRLFF